MVQNFVETDQQCHDFGTLRSLRTTLHSSNNEIGPCFRHGSELRRR